MEGNEMVEYSIHFPGNWTLYHGIFYDGPGQKKVAEVSPVVLSCSMIANTFRFNL